MSKKILSIEIGLHTTRVCELEYGKKNPHVYNCISFDTPENVIEDGFILDKDIMANTLKAELSAAKMTNKDVIFTISSTKIANREVVIPLVPDNKIQAVIDSSASEYFPLDISEYTISYSILERINTKDEKKLKLLLLAAPNNLIKNIYNFAEIMGLHITAIDYTGNSAYQLLKRQVGSGVNVSVQINDQTTLVNVMENEKLVLQRTIPYGAMNIVNAVLDNDVFGKKTVKEAMQLLMQENVINAHLDMGGEGAAGVSMVADNYDRIMKEVRGREDVTNTIQYIMNNINRILDYYMSRNSEKRINTIFLTGIASKFKGIEILFGNETGYDVKKIETLFAVTFNKGLSVPITSQADYLSCIGASIAPVGFVPSEMTSAKDARKESRSMLFVFLTASGIAVAMILYSGITLQMEKWKQHELNKRVEELKPIENIFNEYNAAKEAYENASYMYNLTSNRNYQLNELKEELKTRLPSNMIVTSLTSAGEGVSMNITTDTKISVAELLLQLKEIPSISNATVASIVEEKNNDDTSKKEIKNTFTVACSYVPFNAELDEQSTLMGDKDTLATDMPVGEEE